MKLRYLVASLVLLTPEAVAAQVYPEPVGEDPHLQAVDFDARQVVHLRGNPGYQTMIELSADEKVESVALGDPSAWQVSVNKDGDRVFLKPVHDNVSTNMTVVTSVRTYLFDLISVSQTAPDIPFTVQFRFPAAAKQPVDNEYVDVGAAKRRISRYRITGDRSLRPAEISNDGERTFISWPRSALIPAVYADNANGLAMLVNGMMSVDDVYVVDGVPDNLTFRIDGNTAHATRITPKKRR